MPWSKKQHGAMGSAYSAKKAGRGKPSQTPAGIWNMPMESLRKALKEGIKKGKKGKRKKK
jgi:hypothetical protein